MSRIGNMPITVPAGVEVKIDGNHIAVKGPKGSLERDIHPNMKVELDGNTPFIPVTASLTTAKFISTS